MAGRRIDRRERKYNPLFILFLCLTAAVITLLIAAIVMGAKLNKAGKSLKAAEKQVRELEQTVEQIEDELEAARGHVDMESGPGGTALPSTQPAQQQQQTANASWLDLSGHSEVQYRPTELLDGYQTYYATDSVNLRGGPATSYTRIETVSRGAAVKVAAREGGWSFAKAGDRFGWINSSYLSKNAPAPEPAQTAARAEATSGSLKTG